jgi:tRNA-(ms[2]io[6]A)-hydroxylase
MNLIDEFLQVKTPSQWVGAALGDIETLLIDHALCEKKAASTALSMIYRYIDKPKLLDKLSRIAREELRHFEQVLKILQKRSIEMVYLKPSNYAEGLRQHVRHSEPYRLVDILIIGAFIEARSCERFNCLVPHLDEDLADFYRGLCAAEARHYQEYLNLAKFYANEDIQPRIDFFAVVEAELILKKDNFLRFHSGVPSRLY